MKTRPAFDLPQELDPEMRRAVRLEWVTLVAMIAVAIAIYLVVGGSQAMKAAWIEDMLSLVAPSAFLISAHYRSRPPDEDFPYGYHRAVSIAFLAGAVALALFGAFILYDSVMTLVSREHPTIGTTALFGHVVWSGWVMMGVLFLSGIPPVILGHLKMGPARRLHDKTLKADADMNRADWLTALAGIVGITGIGLGLWWADAAAGSFISVTIIRDGAGNLAHVVADLMDRRPLTVDGEVSDIPQRVVRAIRALPWVDEVNVRFREEGHVFTGELFVLSRTPGAIGARVEEVRRVASEVDWRVGETVVELDDGSMPLDR